MNPRFLLAPLVLVSVAACSDDEEGGSLFDTVATSATSDATATTTAATTSDTAAPGTDAAPGTSAAPATSAAAPATSTGAPTSAPAGTAAVGAEEGFLFTDAEGTYTAVFPAEPESIPQEQPLPDGTTIPVTIVLYNAGVAGFTTATVGYAPGTVADLDGAVQGMLTNTGATLIEQTDIEHQGIPGRQVVASVDAGAPGTLIGRIYARDNRLWQVLYTGAGEHTPDEPEIAAFLDSFQITEGG